MLREPGATPFLRHISWTRRLQKLCPLLVFSVLTATMQMQHPQCRPVVAPFLIVSRSLHLVNIHNTITTRLLWRVMSCYAPRPIRATKRSCKGQRTYPYPIRQPIAPRLFQQTRGWAASCPKRTPHAGLSSPSLTNRHPRQLPGRLRCSVPTQGQHTKTQACLSCIYHAMQFTHTHKTRTRPYALLIALGEAAAWAKVQTASCR